MDTNANNYSGAADAVFNICLEFMNDVMANLPREIPKGSLDSFQTSSSAGTALFEYATLLLRSKLRQRYSTEFDFEREDNAMINTFARKLGIPTLALHKIITKKDDLSEWKWLVLRIPIDNVDAGSYVKKVEDVINNWEQY